MTYESVATNAFRYLGVRSLDEVDAMTLEEYGLRMKAFGLQRLDREHDLHKQAYLNLVVQSTKERGKKSVPVYPTFQSFFDMERREREVTGAKQPKERDKHSHKKRLVLLANSRGGQDE